MIIFILAAASLVFLISIAVLITSELIAGSLEWYFQKIGAEPLSSMYREWP